VVAVSFSACKRRANIPSVGAVLKRAIDTLAFQHPKRQFHPMVVMVCQVERCLMLVVMMKSCHLVPYLANVAYDLRKR